MALFEAYLARRGVISVRQLASALREGRASRPPLSAVALRGGLLSVKQVGTLRSYCHAGARTFEQAALELEFLDAAGVRKTLELQQSLSRDPIEWLLSQRIFDPTHLPALELQFQAENDVHQLNPEKLRGLDRRASAPLAQAVEQIQLLRPFPDTANRIINILKHHDFQVAEVAQEFERDPALTGRLLALANSAMFSIGAPCINISQALTKLGALKVRDIVYSLAFFGLFEGLPPGSEEVRKHSIGVAAMARALAVHTPGANRDLAFLAGLMHDIGKLILLKTSLGPPSAEWRADGGQPPALAQASDAGDEVTRLGFDHSLLSALALRAWGFPDVCCETVADHHFAGVPRTRRHLARELLIISDALEHTMARGSAGIATEARLPVPLPGWTPKRLIDYWPLLEEARHDSVSTLCR